MSCGNTAKISPLSGALDTRTASGSLLPSDYRVLLNVDGQQQPTLGRLGGWLHYGSGFGCLGSNHDLHDQLLESITPPVPDNPSSGTNITPFPAKEISLLFSVKSVGGRRRLLAASRSEIWLGDDLGGSWRVLGYGFGGTCTNPDAEFYCHPRRFRAVQLGNIVVLTNGFDRPLQWTFDGGPSGDLNWSVDQIEDLTVLNITAARHIAVYNGFVLIANVVADSQQWPSRIIWSDFNDPAGWIPGGESIAGSFDFGGGEVIMAMASIGTTLRVYTDQAIYDGSVTTDDQVFNFQEIYRGTDCVKYENSFVTTGEEHFFFSEDSAFVMTAYDRTPRRIEWLHRTVGVIFHGLDAEWVDGAPEGVTGFPGVNKGRCEQMVSGYDAVLKAIWVSWPTGDDLCASRTLVLWPHYQKATLVDHGFTAFANHRPDLRQNVRDFADTFGFCAPNSQLLPLEQQPCDNGAVTRSYSYFFNGLGLSDMPVNWFGKSVSGNWLKSEQGPDGALAAMCGTCLQNLCAVCDTDLRFLMADAQDKTIKQFEPEQYVREVYSGVTPQRFPVPDGPTYTQTGYTTLVQGDSRMFDTEDEKLVVQALVSSVSPVQSPVGQMNFQIGGGVEPGRLSWGEPEQAALSDYDGPNTDSTGRPGSLPTFQFYDAGNWIAWRFYVTGTGSAFTAGAVVLKLQERRTNF